MVSYNGLHNLTFLLCFLFSRFVTFIWDNNDINPETLTGVSMHCTNGIMVQIYNNREATSISKRDRDITRKRPFSYLPNTMTYYVSKKRVDPSDLVQTNLEKSIKFSLLNSQYIDFIWVLCSHLTPEKIPNWTGYFIILHTKRGKVRTFKNLFIYQL